VCKQETTAMEDYTDWTMEEYLNYLEECSARRMGFKQAFRSLGMVDKNKPLKQLNDKESFCALVNWAIHRMPRLHSMVLRVKYGAVYQAVIVKSLKNLRVGKLERVAEPGGIAYEWPEATRYDSLEVEIINASVQRANEFNMQRGYDKSVLERALQAQKQADEIMNEECPQDPQSEEEMEQDEASTSEKPWSTPKITLRQDESNVWQVVLTEQERELIDEFLET